MYNSCISVNLIICVVETKISLIILILWYLKPNKEPIFWFGLSFLVNYAHSYLGHKLIIIKIYFIICIMLLIGSRNKICLFELLHFIGPRGESGMDNPPLRIWILRIWRSVFNICADVDNPNLIICGCGVGYGIGEIRWIWIIR